MSAPISISMPDELLDDVRETAKATGLSQQDVMQRSIQAGLPQVREQLGGTDRVTNVDPLPSELMERIYSNPERDEAGIDKFIAGQPKGVRD
jgi:hypothetical protein